MSTVEVEKMSTHERLVAMEQLWDALCRDGAEPASPSWHESVLAQRKAKMESAGARFLKLDQLRDQFR